MDHAVAGVDIGTSGYRAAFLSRKTADIPNLKALLDNSDANKPARYIIFMNREALANLGPRDDRR
jgi:hypothetical protein